MKDVIRQSSLASSPGLQSCVPDQEQDFSPWIDAGIEKQTVFSCLYNEGSDYVIPYLRNFIKYTDYAILYLNIATASWEEVMLVIERHAGELLVGTRIFPVCGRVERSAFGATLLLGHIENFELASQAHPFQYFCTLASNSLFFRQFSGEAVQLAWRSAIKRPEVALRAADRSGNWKQIRSSETFLSFFEDRGIDRFCCNQIEGFFTRRENWSLIANEKQAIGQIEASFQSKDDRFPVEEVLPGTLVANLGDSMFIHLCWNLWERKAWGGKVNASDLVFFSDQRYPLHTFLLKWFDRDQDAPATRMIVEQPLIEYARSLDQLIGTASPRDLAVYHQILDAATAKCVSRMYGADLIAAFYPDAGTDVWVDLHEAARRQQVTVFGDRKYDSYVFFEDLGNDVFDFRVKLYGTVPAAVGIEWSVQNTHGIEKNKRNLVAYWYVRQNPADISRTDFIQFKTRTPGLLSAEDQSRSFGAFVICVDGRYVECFCDYITQGRDCIFDFHFTGSFRKEIAQASSVYIGFPVLNNVDVRYEINSVENRTDRESCGNQHE